MTDPYNFRELFGLLLAAWFVLYRFSCWYDLYVNDYEKHTGAYTAIFVAGGVGVTLAVGLLFVGLVNTAILLSLFIASGLPMIRGSIQRNKDDAAQARENARESLTHDDK